MGNRLPWRLHREIADTYQTEREAREAYLRINRFLEEIERWPGPYVPPAVAEQDPEPPDVKWWERTA